MTLVRTVIRSKFLLAHDLFRKPVPTFRDHALAGLTSVAEVRPRNADAGVRFLRPAPIGKSAEPGLGCDRTTVRVTSPTAEAMRSDRIQSEFKSPVTHHPASRRALRRMPSEALAEEGICPRSPIGRGPGLNPGQCGFDARRGYARVAQRQRQRLQTPLSGRSNRPSRTKQRSLRSPSGQRHRSYTPTFRGSNPRRSTILLRAARFAGFKRPAKRNASESLAEEGRNVASPTHVSRKSDGGGR
jgi:hypothetical protein